MAFLCPNPLTRTLFQKQTTIGKRVGLSSSSSRAPAQCLRHIPIAQSSQVKSSVGAKLYTTGEKLSVRRVSAEQQTDENSNMARYIVCPHCSTAYIGNAVTTQVKVSCASCDMVFQTSPSHLYVLDSPGDLSQKPLIDEELSKNVIQCKHMSTCSGCSLSREVNQPPLVSEARKFFSRAFNMHDDNVTVEMEKAIQWRTHAKLAVRRDPSIYKMNGVVVGLFKSRSHQVVSIPGCVVHAPEIERVADIVREVLWKSGLTIYDETTGRGTIRYVLFTSERGGKGRVQVTLVWNALSWKDASPDAQVVGAELWRRGRLAGGVIHSIWFNWNTSSGNAIINPERERFYHMHGEMDLVDTVCDVRVTFPPYTFRQANLDAFEKLVVPKLLTYIPRGCQVAELYAGVGVIGLIAIKHRGISRLVASEIHGGAKDEFWKAIAQLRKEGYRNTEVEFLVNSDEEAINFIDENIDVVIVDPPRGGLNEDVADRLAQFGTDSKLNRIIYVSCGFDSLKRDSKRLCENRNWTVTYAHLYVLFPGSDHLETLAVFDRTRRTRDGARTDEYDRPQRRQRPDRFPSKSRADSRRQQPNSRRHSSFKRSRD